MVPYGMFSFHF